MIAKVLGELLHGEETGFMATRPIAARVGELRAAPNAKDFTNQRYRYRGVVDEVERGKNRTKSSVRAKVEHPFLVLKGCLGSSKTATGIGE